jgi:hypothetical protein
VWLLAAFLALPAGQGVAFALQGDGFVWPGPRLGESLLGLFGGEPGRGLGAELRADLPPVALVYTAAIVVEMTLATAALAGFTWWWRTVGPYAQFGMAAKHEVIEVLGRAQLMRRRGTIRPDMGGGGRR